VNRTILCIDDDRKVVDELEATLGGRDHRLLHTSDLEHAFRLVREQKPDLLVLEIDLAGGDGLDFVERIRESSPRPGLPVVVVTTAGRTPARYGRAVQLGVEDYLVKPLLRSQLVACIEECASRETARKRKHRDVSPDLEGGGSPGEGRVVSGRIEKLPLPEILDRLHRRGESGVLIVGDSRQRTGIQMRNGSPVAVGLTSGESFEDYLVRTGRISPADRDRACNEIALGVSSPQSILVGMGVIDDEGYEAALRERAEEGLLRLFQLEKGRYRFEAGRRLKSARSQELTRSAESLIVRGVLAWSSAETVRRALSRFAELYVVANAISERDFQDVPCSPAQRELIAGLAGDRTVGDFLELSEFEQRTLYAFSLLGVIDLSVEPVLLLSEVLDEAKPRSQPQPQRLARREAPKPPARDARRVREEPSGVVPAAAPVPDSLEEEPRPLAPPAESRESGQLGDGRVRGKLADFAEARSPEDSGSGQEKPHAIAPFGAIAQDPAARAALARRVKNRLARTLGDRIPQDSEEDTQRLESASPSVSDTAARALEAESWFRKGRDLLKGKKYSEAVEAFGMSAHLDPTEGEYVAHLGYALYLSNPTEELVRKEALEDIARGIKLSPDREMSYVYLGRIFKVMGDLDVARKMFSRALAIRPHCREAEQELRLMEMRAEKTSGFLQRFRK
jgi:CheY-like chemotaxis protein/Flp pilus assembly protein TadD